MPIRTKPRGRIAWVLLGLALLVVGTLGYAQLPALAQDTAPACAEQVRNGSFETDTDWSLPVTAYSAAYSTAQIHSGARSLRVGIANPADNVFSYSSASQPIVIPTGVQTATLTFWWYPLSGEGPLSADSTVDAAALQAIATGASPATALAGDRQYVLLLNEQNTVLAQLLWTRSNAQIWQPLAFDLAAYAGQTVRLLFGVYNDGVDGATALFVDEVSVVTCAPAAANYLPWIANDGTATPPTATPVATLTPTATPTSTVVWSAPSQAIEVFSPVANGLYHSPLALTGFSQTFEGVVNLRLTDKDGQVLAERNTMGGSVDGFAFFDSYLRFTVSAPISATVEVFETSAMDGSEIHKVAIPVVLLPGQRVIDLTTPAVGATVCNPIVVSGYSNTFEATVGVTLQQRNGTPITLTSTTGGNLGVYADFMTVLSPTVTTPQPLLVSAFEESAAGNGLIDQTVLPIALYPTGNSHCP